MTLKKGDEKRPMTYEPRAILARNGHSRIPLCVTCPLKLLLDKDQVCCLVLMDEKKLKQVWTHARFGKKCDIKPELKET